MKKVFVTRSILPDGIMKLREKGFEVEVWNGNELIPTNILYEKAQSSEALITMLSDKIDHHFLHKNKHLKVITNYAVGLNNIDLKAAKDLGIAIGNTPDVLTDATAEVAFGLMIACARQFKGAQKNAENGSWKTWEPLGFLGISLKNKNLGIIGHGRIGKEMAKLAENSFGMKIHIYKRNSNLNDFLKDLDVLSLHVPLTEETRHLIGEKQLSSLKTSAIIINTARGEIIDQEALYEALKSKKLFAAGLDVTSPEPLDPKHPLYSLDNALILPHIGSATYEARRLMSLVCADNIIKNFS